MNLFTSRLPIEKLGIISTAEPFYDCGPENSYIEILKSRQLVSAIKQVFENILFRRKINKQLISLMYGTDCIEYPAEN